MLTITHLLITIFALWIYILWSRRKFYKVFLQLPGPWGLPLVGLAFKMMKPESVLQYMGDLAKEYKAPFISWMGSQCFLYVNDPETMEIIFKSPCCTNKGDVYRFMANAIGDGLFTSSSPRWNKHRRLLNPAFSRKAIQAFLPVFNREASTLVKKMAVTQGQTLEIYGLLKKIVLEIACQTTMGKKMNFQDNRSTAIFEAYNGITETCVTRMLSPWLYLDVVYQFSALNKRQQQFSVALQKFVENLLADDGQTEVSHSQLGEKSREDRSFKLESQNLLDIVREHIAANQLTSQDARDEANVIVAATFETTSTALYFACLCLAMHPECQDKLYKELVEIFPKSYDSADTRSGITLEQLQRMKYMDMVMNESMRLLSPVPMVLRRVSEDFHFQNVSGERILLPKNTQIALDIFNMHRSENSWGPYASSFEPELHFGPNVHRHAFAFLPFTKGLRMCLGYRYALVLMKVMLAHIFRNFRISTESQLKDLNVKGTISLKLGDYPLCTIQARHDNLFTQ